MNNESIRASKYRSTIDIAKQIEIWAGNLRYKNDEINYDVTLATINHLNKISCGKIIISTDLDLIKTIVHDLEKIEPAPENIKNKLLIINAFYSK